MHAMPEWFAVYGSCCAVTITTRITNYPLAGVYLLYEGEVVQNHGIVLFKYSTTVNCLTDSPHSNIGTWFYPNGAAVSSSSSDPLLYQVRWTSVVSLNRKNGDLPSYGIYRCDIPDKQGFIYSLYVGLYDDSGKVLLLVLIDWFNSTTLYTFHSTWLGITLENLYKSWYVDLLSIYIAYISCIHIKNITMLVSARMVNNPHKPDPSA